MSDLIYRQEAINAFVKYVADGYAESPEDFDGYIGIIKTLPSAEPVKVYTKADYIMALHKEYGCTLTMAEEAHNKALEYLRSKARMKG